MTNYEDQSDPNFDENENGGDKLNILNLTPEQDKSA
jgi:hypothetical protein